MDDVRIAISMGDPNGIGPEVVLRTLEDHRITEVLTPVVFGSGKVLNFYRKQLNLQELNLHMIHSADQAHPNKVNVVNSIKEDFFVAPGEASEASGQFALSSLQSALEAVQKGQAHALVTAPLNKSNIRVPDEPFSGHTEYLEKRSKGKALMILTCERFRVGLVTGHVPLQEVASHITVERILDKLSILEHSLRTDFNVRRPRIAVLGLNPHAGDGGLMGKEEQEIIAPAIEQAQARGWLAYGPFPSDGFFGRGLQHQYDAVLAMYHDQGLIPFKTLAFEQGVNFTAGLDLVRTSPDHGTAYDLAGKGTADPASFREALFLAKDLYMNRNLNRELMKNPLPIQSRGKDK